jgi:hypothetical protein
MELLLIIPLIMFMGGAAVYMALSERPMPMPSRNTWFPASPTAGTSTHPTAPENLPFEGLTINQSDVLLADALTEMLGLKEEITSLRQEIGHLDQEVQRLSSARRARQTASEGAASRPVRARVRAS